MSNYVVFDLEWNQGANRHEQEIKELPFEIIEIGAVRLDEERNVTGEFHRLIKPQVYHKMHSVTGRIIHMKMKDLEEGDTFIKAAGDFLEFAGDSTLFCSWGTTDLPELQRNMEYYHMEPITDGPMKFYDIQKLFSLQFEDGKSRRSLEYAIDFLKIGKDNSFHRALADAQYTAEIFRLINDSLLRNVSFDSFCAPKDKRQEIHIVFDNYAKYISRVFDTKDDLLTDREVMSTKCYLCHKNLHRKIKWFTVNGKHYYCVSVCNIHGSMKSKVRIRQTEDGKFYAVKTSKFVDDEEAASIISKQTRAKNSYNFKKRLT